MKIQLRRGPQGFVPDSQHDADALERVGIGDVIYGEFRMPRNPGHHRKAFKLLQMMYENQDGFDTFGRFLDWVKLKAELCDLVEMTDKGPVYKLRSLSFASMDQTEFNEVYERIVTVAYEVMGIDAALDFA